MIVTLNLQTSFKVNVYPLIKCTSSWSMTTLDQREKRYSTDKMFHFILQFTSHSTLKLNSRSLHTLFLKAVIMKSLSQIWPFFFYFDIFITHMLYNKKKWHLRVLTIHGLSEKQNVTDKVIHVNYFNSTCFMSKKRERRKC